MKKDVGRVSAIPSKRLFWSIIADYNLNLSICELVDNALDIWVKHDKSGQLSINIDLDQNQQTIIISDNAGGVMKEDLRVIVGPGQTTNLPTEKVIGIFGVGTKRAVVALAQEIKITTRHGKDKTHRVEIDESWLREAEEWELPVYEVDEIAEGSTIVDLQRLRVRITDEAISQLKRHLEATYARFLKDNRITIKLNQYKLQPLFFEDWAYPPDFEPRKYFGDMQSEEGRTVKVEVIAGLTMESSPAGGEYGVYFYCNDRLIVRGLKSYDVGYTTGLVGLPHPSVSLARVIVSLKGEVQSMPWNSSKSGINPNHNVYTALRDWLVQIVKECSSLSRRLQGNWPEKVFKYKTGKITEIKIDDLPNVQRSYLPPLPKSKLRYADLMKKLNQKIAGQKPWTRGLYESIVAVDVISKQRLEQKNRVCLILLDSTLEIAFKEFLVNDSGHVYGDRTLLQLFRNRDFVHKEIQKYKSFKQTLWGKIEYYYKLRCKLIHERATVAISNDQIEDYRRIVEKVLIRLFKLQFRVR